MNTHALILAAGKGARFGHPKAWIAYQNTSLVQAHINHLAMFMPVIVVVSQQEDAKYLHNCQTIENPKGDDMMSSVRQGVALLPSHSHVLIIPVDTLPIKPKSMMKLIACPPPAVLSHQGKRGHPILLTVQSIHSLSAQQNLKDLVRQATYCEGDISCTYNFNYPQDWERIFGAAPRRWNRNNTPKIR